MASTTWQALAYHRMAAPGVAFTQATGNTVSTWPAISTRACMQVFLLEGENKKLTRALVREVGEGIPLQKVLEEGSGADWRGRREQIIRLQDTVRQLREAAAAAGAGGSDGQGAARTANSSSVGGSLAKHEASHRTQISKANKQKDSELQRMAAELALTKAATEQLRLKFTGASSRRKVLEEEVSSGSVLGTR